MTVLTVAILADVADAAAGLLHLHGAEGVELRDGDYPPSPGLAPPAPGQAELRGYFEVAADAGGAAKALLSAFGAQSALDEVPVEDWTVSWRRHFRPIQRGRILVAAPWMDELPTPTGGVRVVVEPGLAFGTGDHPTTGLCLEMLDLWLQAHPAASVLDVGTGSGILAIAARKLGAGETCATDNDPVALRTARQNGRANGVVFDVREDIPHGARFDLVMANILSNTLVELAPQLAAAVAPGGRLALSGILESQADEVEAAYRPLLRPDSRTHEAGWVCLELDREEG